jgi:hypothetical protein
MAARTQGQQRISQLPEHAVHAASMYRVWLVWHSDMCTAERCIRCSSRYTLPSTAAAYDTSKQTNKTIMHPHARACRSAGAGLSPWPRVRTLYTDQNAPGGGCFPPIRYTYTYSACGTPGHSHRTPAWSPIQPRLQLSDMPATQPHTARLHWPTAPVTQPQPQSPSPSPSPSPRPSPSPSPSPSHTAMWSLGSVN